MTNQTNQTDQTDTSNVPSVAIVDDDPIVCSSIATILQTMQAARVLWTAHDGQAAIEQYSSNPPDVLLIDVQMPIMDGLEASARILQTDSNARILILTTFCDEDYIRRALALNTRGYLIKQDVASVIPAISSVMAGQVVLGADVLDRLRLTNVTQTVSAAIDPMQTIANSQAATPSTPSTHELTHDSAVVNEARKRHHTTMTTRFDALTDREISIVEEVAQGYDNHEIAAHLYLSEGTVRNRISDILLKTHMSNRTKLAVEWLAAHESSES